MDMTTFNCVIEIKNIKVLLVCRSHRFIVANIYVVHLNYSDLSILRTPI